MYSRELWIEYDDAKDISEGEKITLMKWGNANVTKKVTEGNKITIWANIDEEDADLFFGIDGGDAENEPDSGQTNNDGDDNDDDSKGGPVKLDQKKHHTLGVVKSSFSGCRRRDH